MFALVFITVISIVVIAVLSLADASMRATIKLRGQAAESAAAEGAANVAVNALRESTYTGAGGCFGGTSELSVPSSQLPGPDTMSALVSCTPDSTMAQFPLGAPAQAILSTANDMLPGIAVNDPAMQWCEPRRTPACASAATSTPTRDLLVGAQAQLVAEGGGVVRARNGCLLPPGITHDLSVRHACRNDYSQPPSAQCNSSTVPLTCPQCAQPSRREPGRPAVQPVPACAPIMTFTPGRYTDVAALTNRTSGSACGANTIFHFLPGTYYFDFPPTTITGIP